MKAKINLPHNIGGELEVSKEEMSGLGKFFWGITPSFLKEEMGILTDNSKFRRFKNIINITNEANRLMEENNLTPQILPLKFSLPFIEKASLEEDQKLQRMWTNLLLNASSRRTEVNNDYISVLEKLTPDDAITLNRVFDFIKEKRKILNHTDSHTLDSVPWLFPFSEELFHEKQLIVGNEYYLKGNLMKDKFHNLGIIKYSNEMKLPGYDSDFFRDLLVKTNLIDVDIDVFVFTPFGYMLIKSCRDIKE